MSGAAKRGGWAREIITLILLNNCFCKKTRAVEKSFEYFARFAIIELNVQDSLIFLAFRADRPGHTFYSST